MSKKPYIPIYIGDWERDTGCLSPIAEFALLKLTFKLFDAQKKGVFYANFSSLSRLFKSNLDETKLIFQELIDNNILDIEPCDNDKFCIKSRRMIREANISELRAESGKEGGRGNKANQKQIKSKLKAKSEQNADIDIEYIVKLLNEKSCRDFKKTNAKTISLINARKLQGFTKEDFERVIIFKCNQWLNDEKMNQYLQPETLFGNKFEGYLQASKSPINLAIESSEQVDVGFAGLMGDDYRKPAGGIK